MLRRLPPPLVAALAGGLLLAHAARASSAPGGVDMMPVLEALALVLIGARLGGSLFERLGQPAVLGELVAGIVLGNLGLVGVHEFDSLRSIPALDVLAQLGVLFLLFAVGLESDIGKMMAVGTSAALVAVLGVVAPMLLGYASSAWAFPQHQALTHLFVGATLSATSVGITARVLGDMGRANSSEGRIILGAAVIDDVLGLIVLAVVTGVISAADHGSAFIRTSSVLVICAKAFGFLLAAVFLGQWLSKARVPRRLEAPCAAGCCSSFALAFCFLLACLAGKAGLAPIVGAFAAGLVLEEVHYRDLLDRDQQRRDIHHLTGAPVELPRAGVLRADGHARRRVGVRAHRGARVRGGAHGGGADRQTGLRARRAGQGHRPARGGAWHDPAWRGGLIFASIGENAAPRAASAW